MLIQNPIQSDKAIDIGENRLREQRSIYNKNVRNEVPLKVILGSKNPGWFDDKFLADLNTLLQKQGKPGQLTLGNEKRDGETELILAKNGMEISCTFASLLDSWRLDMEADIAAILFPDRPA